jgi:hypothetical protein
MADSEEEISPEATEVGPGVGPSLITEDFEVECLGREAHLAGAC